MLGTEPHPVGFRINEPEFRAELHHSALSLTPESLQVLVKINPSSKVLYLCLAEEQWASDGGLLMKASAAGRSDSPGLTC